MRDSIRGAINITFGVALASIAAFFIYTGITYGDIKKGVDAYETTRGMEIQLAVLNSKMDSLIGSNEEIKVSIIALKQKK